MKDIHRIHEAQAANKPNSPTASRTVSKSPTAASIRSSNSMQPSIEMLDDIADALGVDASMLFN